MLDIAKNEDDARFQKFGGFLEAVTIVFVDVARRRDLGELDFLVRAIYQIGQKAKIAIDRGARRDN